MNLLALARRLDKIIEQRGDAGDTCQVLIYDEQRMMRPAIHPCPYTPQPEAAGLAAAYAAWGLRKPRVVLVLPDNGHGPGSGGA